MKSMTSKERFIKTLKGEPADKIPFCDYMDEAMEIQLRKHYGFENDPSFAFFKHIGMDAVQFCEYYAPLFVGDPKTKTMATQTKLHGDGSAQAFVEEGLIHGMEDLKLMQFPDLRAPGFYDFADRYIEQCNKLEMASCFALRAFPVHTTIYTMGLEAFSYALVDEDEVLDEIIKRYNDYSIRMIEDLQDRGMDCIIVCNDMAFNSGPLLSPDSFREVFYEPMKEVAKAIKVPYAFHSDGNLLPIFDDLLALTKCLNPIDPNCMDIYKVSKDYPDLIPWGNLDVNVLGAGSTEDVKRETLRLLETIGSQGSYIFGSGNSIPYYSKIENVITMVETYKEFVGK